MPRPARRLLGLDLDDGWKVVSEVIRGPEATGGRFSAGYIVERASGERGFLKALDYSRATLPGVDTPAELQRLTTEYLFERDIVSACVGKSFSRVVRGIGYGKVTVAPGLDGQVEYLIFELAAGDIRKQMSQARRVDAAWRLRVLHQVATGLFQLHTAQVAHQDLKPSNVLDFDSEGIKIGDLGRAAKLRENSPHDGYQIAGARAYAPPELLYGELSADWQCRRIGCDLYHLGSLAVFLFASANMTGLLLAELSLAAHPSQWRGTYRDVLPQVQKAFGQALGKISVALPDGLREEVLTVVRQLCEPDPLLRGHPRDRRSINNRYTCERYVGVFNRLASEAELGKVLTTI
jgi:serine/threonine protein kinase